MALAVEQVKGRSRATSQPRGSMSCSLSSPTGKLGSACQAEPSQAHPGRLNSQEWGKGCGEQNVDFKGPGTFC